MRYQDLNVVFIDTDIDTSSVEREYMGVKIYPAILLSFMKVSLWNLSLLVLHSWDRRDLERFSNGGARIVVLSKKCNADIKNAGYKYYVVGDISLYDFISLINPFPIIHKDTYKELSLQNLLTDKLYMDKGLNSDIGKDDCVRFAFHIITILQTYNDLSKLCVSVNIDVLFSLESIATLYFQNHRYKARGVKPIINSYKQIPLDSLPELRQVRWRIISIAETILSKLQQIKEYTNK